MLRVVRDDLSTVRAQVNAEMMGRAGKDCLFMHCLPAERGRECTDEVIEGAQSVVWDQVWVVLICARCIS